MRLKITISYNGKAYNGSQIQKNSNVKTVNAQIESSLKKLTIDTKVHASGRTDTGVHAFGQVIHIDVDEHFSDTQKFKTIANRVLSDSIRFNKVEIVDENFHARYSAKSRVYRYIIKVGDSNPFEESFVTFVKTLHVEKIKTALKYFIGEHNFKYFKKEGANINSDVRVIKRAFIYKYKDYYIINLEANGFLRSQVRLIVGFLLKISDSKLGINELQEQLNLKKIHNRHLAPPNGLYLAKIKY